MRGQPPTRAPCWCSKRGEVGRLRSARSSEKCTQKDAYGAEPGGRGQRGPLQEEATAVSHGFPLEVLEAELPARDT